VELDQLATAARHGDRGALEQLLRQLQGDVWRFCAHLTRRELADDTAQETLTRIISNLHRWQRGPIKTWALGVARNVCFEELRRQSRRRTAPANDVGLHDPSPDAHGVVDIADLLDELPGDQREALVLTQLIGLSYAEAADVMDCAVGTIRSRVARGRDSLTAALRPASSEERSTETG